MRIYIGLGFGDLVCCFDISLVIVIASIDDFLKFVLGEFAVVSPAYLADIFVCCVSGYVPVCVAHMSIACEFDAFIGP